MSVVFFVHGTGVRQAGYEQTLQSVKNGLNQAGRPDLTVVGVSWGTLVGTHVSADDITAMLPPTAAKGSGATDLEVVAQLWAQLLEDPLFELRLAAVKAPQGPMIAQPGKLLPSDALKQRLRALSLGGHSPAGGVTLQDIQAAGAWLADGDGAGTLTAAAAAIGDAKDPALVGAAARAAVAYVLLRSRGEIGTGPNALYVLSDRIALVDQVADDLSAGVKGLGDWLWNLALKFAEAQATSLGKSRRTGLMTAVSPGVGDILLYQRRGQQIQSLLTTELAQLADQTVYVLGHSLGGIFLVDLLSAGNRPPNVKGLVTVASQSPFFYACDALAALRPGQSAQAPFTPWLNIFDRNDFLSFCASRIYGPVPGIEDFEFASGVSFPDSHGAYFRSQDVYRKIATFCK